MREHRRPLVVLRHLALATLVSSGCDDPGSLGATRIVGGTAQERRDVRAELEAFEAWVGTDRVRLSKVMVEQPPHPDADGLQRGRRVWVRPGLGTFGTRRTLRHELCHALDQAEDLVEGFEPAEVFDDPVFDPFLAGSDADPRKEVMARICEAGPTTIRALREPCPSEAPAITAVVEWTGSAVYTAVEEFGTTTLSAGDWTAWAAPQGASDLVVLGTVDVQVMLVRGMAGGGEQVEWYLDATTAEEVQPAPLLAEEGATWESDDSEYRAVGLRSGSRRPGVLHPLLVGLPTEPRLVEAAGRGLLFPTTPVCLAGGALRPSGTAGEQLRLVQVDPGLASWADLRGLQ